MELAPLINKVAKFVPKRRKRKLHIGLFGYCRTLGEHCLPRAIAFTASLCSIGLPPSILGINILNQKEYDFIKTQYIYFEEDLKDALKYYNPDQKFLSFDIDAILKEFGIDYEFDEEHKKITDSIIQSLSQNKSEDLTQKVLLAANIRKFLG
jgi:phosphoenolpyruvate carboxylase